MKKSFALFVFTALVLSVFGLASCSDDDTPTTGCLEVMFVSWNMDWNDKTTLYISPIDQPNYALKRITLSSRKKNKIELNAGNYILNCTVDEGGSTMRPLLYNEPVQIQLGKTETITISGKDH